MAKAVTVHASARGQDVSNPFPRKLPAEPGAEAGERAGLKTSVVET